MSLKLFLQPASLDKQLHLSSLVGGAAWHFDLTTGLLSLGKQYLWHTQLLGTEISTSGDWRWAWANAASNIPAHLLQASLALKAYGERQGIPELTTPHFLLDQTDGHTLALLASDLCGANAYYRCRYEDVALFVLIMDNQFPKCTDQPLQRIATIFPQAIAAVDIPDHKAALIDYLNHYDLSCEQDGDKIVVKEGRELVLTATFDEQNRLANLEVKLESAPPVPKGESWDELMLRKMMDR